MAVLVDILAAGVVDSAGLPLSGGQVYVYEPGTTSKVDVWQDADLSVPHANPLTLDAAGKAEVYINESVRVVIEDSAGASIADIEAVGEVASLEGDVTLGSSSADTMYVNGRIRGDLDPAIPATYEIGDASNTWKHLSVDGGTAHGGAIYFDGGTTKYIKSNAAGTDLEVAGFTSVTVQDATVEIADGDLDITTGNVAIAKGTLTVGDGTDTATAPTLIVNANTGDATLRLKVNNSDANAWDIQNDNSASDSLDFEYGGDARAAIRTAGTFLLSDGTNNLNFSPTPRAGATPASTYVYPESFVQMWAALNCGASPNVTVENEFNVLSASYSTDTITVNIDRDMPNTTYVACWDGSALTGGTVGDIMLQGAMRAAASVTTQKLDSGGYISFNSNDYVRVALFGDLA